MEPRDVRGWLLCKPRPKHLRIVAGDSQVHELDITEGVRWVEIARTICSLAPEQIEAFDEKRKLLRAVRPDDVDVEDSAPRNTSLEQDPENARLITFAQLLAEAHKESREFMTTAFDKLVDLFQAQVHKSESQEKTIATMDRMVQKLMLEKVADAAAGAAEGDEPLTLDSLLQAMVQGKMQAEADKAIRTATAPMVVNGAPTNGASKPKEGAKK